MYRQYEDPYALEQQLEEVKRDFAELENPTEEDYMDYSETVGDLEERINFAWQDDEYDGVDYDLLESAF